MRRVAVLILLLPFAACRSKAKDDAPSSNSKPSSIGISLASAIQSQVLADSAPSTKGKMHSEGGEIGTWDITLDACASGEVDGFFGASFGAPGSDDLRMRYVHDEAKGDIVKVLIPSQKGMARVFDSSSKCALLEGHVAKTNFKTWTPKGDIRHIEGWVKFDCTYDNGKGHVTGDVVFSHCH